MIYVICLSTYVFFLLYFIGNGIDASRRIWWGKPRGIDFPRQACGFVATTALNSLFWQWMEGRLFMGEASLPLSFSFLVRALALAYLMRVISLRGKGAM